jgi:hypothetical protein
MFGKYILTYYMLNICNVFGYKKNGKKTICAGIIKQKWRVLIENRQKCFSRVSQ